MCMLAHAILSTVSHQTLLLMSHHRQHQHTHRLAGKSTRLLELAAHEAQQQRRVALVKSRQDVRYVEDSVNTHDGVNARCFVAGTLAEFRQQVGAGGGGGGGGRAADWCAAGGVGSAAVKCCAVRQCRQASVRGTGSAAVALWVHGAAPCGVVGSMMAA